MSCPDLSKAINRPSGDHLGYASMSRKGNPYDNAFCESFMKTLKHEEVYRNEYRDLEDAAACISHFLERVYNRHRLHSAGIDNTWAKG